MKLYLCVWSGVLVTCLGEWKSVVNCDDEDWLRAFCVRNSYLNFKIAACLVGADQREREFWNWRMKKLVVLGIEDKDKILFFFIDENL